MEKKNCWDPREWGAEDKKIRLCFLTDDSGHWYYVPVEYKNRFNELIDNEDYDTFNDEFGDNRLGMHISNYSFTDLRED